MFGLRYDLPRASSSSHRTQSKSALVPSYAAMLASTPLPPSVVCDMGGLDGSCCIPGPPPQLTVLASLPCPLPPCLTRASPEVPPSPSSPPSAPASCNPLIGC